MWILVVSAMCCCSCREGLADRSLEELDAVLKMKDSYANAFRDRMKALHLIYGQEHGYRAQFVLNARLAEEYGAYCLDSTLEYLNRNVILASEARDYAGVVSSELDMVEAYAKSGYHAEAAALVEKYGPETVPAALKGQYFKARHTLAGELMYYTSDSHVGSEKFNERNMLRDSLMKYTEPGSYEWYDLNREVALTAKDSASVRDLAKKMMRLCVADSRKYASACYFYSEGIPRHDEDSIMYWLCKSAVADVKCANKDYASLSLIAGRLFESGDVDRAFRYTADHCMPDALEFNGKLRPWKVSQTFSSIEHEYEQKQRRNGVAMTVVIVVISLLLVMLALLLASIYRHHRVLARTNAKLTDLNSRLKESDKIKEEYIALFLGMVSDNVDKTRKYQNHVLKYLRRGNDKYIMDEIESMPPVEDDIRQFYKMFDEAFIKLYPDFIGQFNALLADGSQVSPKEPDILSPELRIFALIKLGVTESAKIAALLHYSANTVYNYRAKIKNKSRGPRDKFEDAVREIR